MSLWLNAVAGGLQGLGQSISANDAEKREVRGLTLREKYLRERLDAQIEARAAEGVAGREHQAGLTQDQIEARAAEGVAGREHQAGLTQDQIEARAAEGVAGRAHQAVLTQAQIDARAAEGVAGREHESGERQKDRDLRSNETLLRMSTELAQAQADLSGAQRNDKMREIFDKTYNAVNDQTGERETNPDLVATAMGIYQSQGKPPWEIKVSGADIVESAKNQGQSVDETVARLKSLWFQVPNIAVSRARSLMPEEQPTTQTVRRGRR